MTTSERYRAIARGIEVSGAMPTKEDLASLFLEAASQIELMERKTVKQKAFIEGLVEACNEVIHEIKSHERDNFKCGWDFLQVSLKIKQAIAQRESTKP